MRRVRIERGVYHAERSYGWVYEVGWYDDTGRQRWKTVGPIDEMDLPAVRAFRDELVVNGMGGGSKYKQLRADLFLLDRRARAVPATERTFFNALRMASDRGGRDHWMTVAAVALAISRRFDR